MLQVNHLPRPLRRRLGIITQLYPLAQRAHQQPLQPQLLFLKCPPRVFPSTASEYHHSIPQDLSPLHIPLILHPVVAKTSLPLHQIFKLSVQPDINVSEFTERIVIKFLTFCLPLSLVGVISNSSSVYSISALPQVKPVRLSRP